jgi:hypothetical protein
MNNIKINMNNNETNSRHDYIAQKLERRAIKRTKKRDVTADEVIYIFEKVLENWKTIRIYNTIIQSNPNSGVVKSVVEKIATGNCKLFPHELSKERYEYYIQLRIQVYQHLNVSFDTESCT